MRNDNTIWISVINYIGLAIATFGTYSTIVPYYDGTRQKNMITGCFFLMLAIIVGIGVFVFTGIIIPNSKFNDLVLLITLIISLPVKFYKEIIDYVLK